MHIFRGFNDLFTVVLFPRLIHAVAPALGPVGLLSVIAGIAVLLLAVGLGAAQQLGWLLELGLLGLSLLGLGGLAFALAYLDRMSFTAEQTSRVVNLEVRERLD